MADSRLRFYYVYMENRTDSRDDEVWKVRAASKPQATQLALRARRAHQFSLRHVFTQKGLKRYDPYWHWLLWGTAAYLDAKGKGRAD